MDLTSVSISGYRCFQQLADIPLHRLTVFIGENDAGKTNLIGALQLLLTDSRPSESDFAVLPDSRQDDPARVEEIHLKGVFHLEEGDRIPSHFLTPDRSRLILEKSFTPSNTQSTVFASGYQDDRWHSFQDQKADIQRELLQSIGLEPKSNTDKRTSQFEEASRDGRIPREPKNVQVDVRDLVDYLPSVVLLASTDYRHPNNIITRTLQDVTDNYIRPKHRETGEHQLRSELQEVRDEIQSHLDSQVQAMLESLRASNPQIRDVRASPTIDFSKSVSSIELLIDTGEGLQGVDHHGEGTKKKLWMGLLDWQRETQQQIDLESSIFLYDEPDVNLDYTAERELFRNIRAIAESEVPSSQVVVCTHSLTMVDRAPANSINLIKISPTGRRKIEYLSSDQDEDLQVFLDTVGRTVGISNSSLFYEKCFLVVEGPSEENALPVLYKNIYGHSHIDDGIVIIPLHSSGAWKSILQILLRNKSHITLMLLDADTQTPDSQCKITPATLEDIGYQDEFLNSSCHFIGDREFEDAFANSVIVSALNSNWPLPDGEWTEEDISHLRQSGDKFSDTLITHVRHTCQEHLRASISKPTFSERLARVCTSEELIPNPILTAFSDARQKAGVHL